MDRSGGCDADYMREIEITFRKLDSELLIAIKKGEENYRNEHHKHNMEILKIVGYLIAAIIVLLGALAGVFRYLL